MEIKATTGRSVGLREMTPDLLAVITLDPDALAGTVGYFGPAAPARARAGPLQKNGQRQLSLARLATLRPPG